MKRIVSVEKVRVNPYAISLTVLNLAIDDMDGKPFASFEELYVNLQLSSAVKRALVVKNFHIKSPYARLIRSAKGDFNFADLTAPSMEENKEKENKKILPFLIRDIIIQDGRLLFLDLQKQVEHELTDMRFTLPFISSLPKDARTDIEPVFSARLNNSTISS